MPRSLPRFYVALAVAALILAAPAAHAFTLENADGGKADKAWSPFLGPEKKLDADKDSKNGFKFGASTLTFGAQRNPDQEYRDGVNRMFSPLGRPGN